MKARIMLSLVAAIILVLSFGLVASADGPLGKGGVFEQLEIADGHMAVSNDGTVDARVDLKGAARIADASTADKDATGVEFVETDGADKTDSIIGADNRVQINPTTSIPWKAIVKLYSNWPNGTTTGCSGALIGRHTVSTAGHCVFNRARGGWANSVIVVPGKNGATEPYGRLTATALRSVLGWTRDNDWRYDYGAIILPSDIFWTRVGYYFGFANLSDSSLRAVVPNISGYPGDKGGTTQWFHAGTIRSVDSLTIYHTTDTMPGHSGSPLWRLQDGQRHIVGIHNYGDDNVPAVQNSARRINAAAFDNYLAWRNAPLP